MLTVPRLRSPFQCADCPLVLPCSCLWGATKGSTAQLWQHITSQPRSQGLHLGQHPTSGSTCSLWAATQHAFTILPGSPLHCACTPVWPCRCGVSATTNACHLQQPSPSAGERPTFSSLPVLHGPHCLSICCTSDQLHVTCQPMTSMPKLMPQICKGKPPVVSVSDD